MKEITVSHKVFHCDDFKLVLQYSEKDLSEYTDLTEEEIRQKFDVFARILFNDILPKDRKQFILEADDETGVYSYIFLPPSPSSTPSNTEKD